MSESLEWPAPRVLVIGAQGVLGSLLSGAFAQAGWSVLRGGRRPDEGADFRHVDLDEPETVARAGSEVDVIVTAVPDLGLTAERMVLDRGGLLINVSALPARAGRELRARTSRARGTVVMNAVAGTVPPAGTSWPQNQPVTIEVVAGLALPNLVGQDVNSIEQWAGSNNIHLQPTTVQSSQPQGIIVSQSVAPGSPVAPGSTVSVSVSAGPPEVQIPGNLIGERFQQVQQTLTGLGFKVNGQQSNGFGQKVTAISPSGQAPAGSTITVVYGGFGQFGF